MNETDLVGVRGDTNSYNIAAKQPDGITALPLTQPATDIWFTIKSSVDDADPGLVQKTVDAGGITVTDAPNGLAQVVVAPADTAALRPGVYRYDVQVKEASGRTTTVVRGRFSLEGDSTRAT